MGKLDGRKIAILVAPEGIEQVEMTEPRRALEEAGATVELLSTQAGEVQAFNHLDKGERFPVDRAVGDADAGDYDGLVLPGGVANPDQLRTDESALGFVRGFFEAGKPVAAICHGPWTLIDAGVVAGKSLTSWPSLQADISNAGGDWHDERVLLCSAMGFDLVTSRKPADLDVFNDQLVRTFAQTRLAKVRAGLASGRGRGCGPGAEPPPGAAGRAAGRRR